MFDVCVIGHVTKELIRINGKEQRLLGGVAYYTGVALSRLGSKTKVITRFSVVHKDIDAVFVKENIDIVNRGSDRTTEFENIYSAGMETRKQKVKSHADPFTISDVFDVKAKIFHIGPLLSRDFSVEFVRSLSRIGKISLDIQGLMRKIKNGMVIQETDGRAEILKYVSILKADEFEAKAIVKEKDISFAAMSIAEYGVEEVIITRGKKGSLVCKNKKIISFPAIPPKKIVDVTGAGDTYMAGYLFQRLKSENVVKAAEFAVATATMKIGNHGPFIGTEEDVNKFIAEWKQKVKFKMV